MKATPESHHRPLIEWVFASVSGVLVLCLVALLGYQAMFAETGPPELLVSIDRVEQVDNGTLVTIIVANRGDEAAAEVTVHAAGKQITFDYIAGHAVRRGAFHFPQAVRAETLKVEIGGYTQL